MTSYKNSYLAYFLMYAFYFLSWALFSTLISVYLLDKGYRPSQVSLVVSASFFASMLAQPFIGRLMDKLAVKKVLMVSFALTILGSLAFLMANNIWLYALTYSLVLLLINGANPVLEQLATSSPYSYGKIRIWGTIGYAFGSQLAGLIYDYISPNTIYSVFVVTMSLAIIGVWGTKDQVKEIKADQQAENILTDLFFNKAFLLYLLVAIIYSGILNVGHTYIPAMLQSDGLSVGLATSVVSIAVLCESPVTLLSFIFMDKLKSKQLMTISVVAVLIQYLVYALDINLASKVLMTILFKHAAGMLFIMVNTKIVSSLVSRRFIITGLALIQTGRSLGSIVFQNIAGQILDVSTYANMCWAVFAVLILVLIYVRWLDLPDGTDLKLFSK